MVIKPVCHRDRGEWDDVHQGLPSPKLRFAVPADLSPLATPVITRRSRSDNLWKPVARSCSANRRTCSSIPALSPRKRAGHQALAPLLTRPRYEAPGAWVEIETAALLDFSAADFMGFFASRFDFLRPLAMAASRIGGIDVMLVGIGGRLGNYLDHMFA
jgi:hypothetical protein